MKRLVTSIAASTILAATSLIPVTGHAASAPPRAAMSVVIVSVSPTTVTAKHAIVTFHLRVKGLVLDIARTGKANIPGHGHFQFYVDKIPDDAYMRKDLKQHWLASPAETTVVLNLPPMILGGPGKHRIIVALAQNNFMLYRAPTASVSITAK